ncbi:MAG: Rne/Rng family ribonuclease [Mycobacteriales bacterium]
MLDEPTDSSPRTNDETPEPVKAPRRRRATKATAAPTGSEATEPTAATAEVLAEGAGAPAAGDAVAAGEEPAPTKKAARKAPARKAAAPRKRAAKKVDEGAVPTPPAGTADPAADDVALTEDELAAQAALLEAGPPVVRAAEDDPVVQAAAADDVGTPAMETSAGGAPEPSADDAAAPAVKRTRTRRAASVTFQSPEPIAEPELEPDAAPAGTAADAPAADEGAPAPRRRRRAGTSGAVSPEVLLPQLLEPTTVDAPVAETDERTETGDDDDPDRPRRRRRGRRGRGPRRPEDDAGASGEDDEVPTEPVPTETTETADIEAADTEDEDGDAPAGTRRRRRRRRSGGGTGGDDASDDTGTAVREPRTRSRSGATSADEDGVRGITGSTRMAAKRVRRQEGRDSGRKRQPILSEAEFLARREAVDRAMVVRQKGDRTQIAVLEDGVLVEHYVTRASAQSYAGNVYLGRVQNVLPSMEAAFVDIGKSRNAVLYAGEVNYNAAAGGRNRSIETVLKSGQEVLVQVSKDPIGHKGARLTGQVSLPGRYLVYVPEGTMTGISRKLPEVERERLKKILKKVVPDDAGVIIRTAAEGASEEEIAGDVRRLQAQWEVLQTKAAKGGAPVLLHAEPDLVIRVVRDVFNEDFTRLVVQGDSEWDTIRDYVEFVAPDLAPRLSRHTSEKDVFAEHRIDEQLLKALDRKVYLPSGGSLVIDRTEAMVVIDVNTGKFVGKGGNLEETVTRNNLEAAEEIARQLRLRDVGGIIVVDFIDMVLESNRDLVVRRLVECLGRDRTKHQVAEVTSLGLVQMTRKRVGQGLLESFSEPCESCNGRGMHVHPEPVDERRGDGGGGEEGRRDRAPKRKPIPADAPKPRSALSAEAVPAAAPDAAAADAAEADAADVQGEEAESTPRRRRRGGRGAGAATVAPNDEMAELLVEAAVRGTAEAGPSEQAGPVGLPEPAGLPEPPEAVPAVAPAVADQPIPDAEDLSVDQAPAGADEVAAAPVAEPAPRRRRRATSRPAGPPTG